MRKIYDLYYLFAYYFDVFIITILLMLINVQFAHVISEELFYDVGFVENASSVCVCVGQNDFVQPCEKNDNFIFSPSADNHVKYCIQNLYTWKGY